MLCGRKHRHICTDFRDQCDSGHNVSGKTGDSLQQFQLIRVLLRQTKDFFFDIGFMGFGNVKKCAVGKHPKSEKHGNTAQFSEVERSGTQENCGGIGSGCRLRLHPLPVLRRRQSHRVACIDPDAVVVDKNIAKNDRFDLFSR